MRKFIDIVEAPISVYNTNVEVEPFGKTSFHDDDRKLIHSEKAQNKVHRIWETSVVDVHMYLVDVKRTPDKAFYDIQAGTAKYPPNINATPGAITVVFSNNEGADRVPLTGWMIAHRLLHAIASDDRSEVNTFIRKLVDQQSGIMFDLKNYNSNIMDWTLACAMGTSRAARNWNLTTATELLPEAFAQYILKGKVTLRELPEVIIYKDERYPCIQGNLDFCNRVVSSYADFLTKTMADIIEAAKGKTFYM